MILTYIVQTTIISLAIWLVLYVCVKYEDVVLGICCLFLGGIVLFFLWPLVLGWIVYSSIKNETIGFRKWQ